MSDLSIIILKLLLKLCKLHPSQPLLLLAKPLQLKDLEDKLDLEDNQPLVDK
jgi:hypothetical protein